MANGWFTNSPTANARFGAPRSERVPWWVSHLGWYQRAPWHHSLGNKASRIAARDATLYWISPEKKKKNIGSMYGIYGNIYHQYTPNASIYTIHGSYGKWQTTTTYRHCMFLPFNGVVTWNCWYLLRPQPCNHNQHEIRWNKTCWVDVGVYPIFIHFFVYWCQSTFWQDSEYIGTISQTLGIESKQNVTRRHEIIKCERTGSLFPKNAFNGDVKANNKIHWRCKHLVWNSMVSNDCRIDRVLVFRK